jgi:hypothetical protein
VCSGHRVGDSQSGFRVYPLEALERLGCRTKRYNFEIEVLVRGLWAGLRVVDVPVSVRYFAGQERVSHFRPWVDNARIRGLTPDCACAIFSPGRTAAFSI